MIKLKINNKLLEVPEGTSILKAAEELGFNIPTMCHLEGNEHFTSCMVCLVKDAKTDRLLPSCSVPATEGMELVTDDEVCRESRKAALELLLSEHVGDCEAPCQVVCPAHMNIPLMNRLIAAGNFEKAIEVVKRDIALPAILGRICPAPCEAGCRRKQVDQPVSICLLKGFVADEELEKKNQVPSVSGTGKKIAIIGAGPAGLAAAFYLNIQGHAVSIFEKNEKAGGDLLKIKKDILPEKILNAELESILNSDIKIQYNSEADTEKFNQLRVEFDAVVIATGNKPDLPKNWGLQTGATGIRINKETYQTSEKNVFAIGNALRSSKLAVRSVGQGKELAFILDDWLKTQELSGLHKRFNSKFGKLRQTEFAEYLKESNKTDRLQAKNGKAKGFIKEEAITEATRCLHCDCRNLESCKLRSLSDEFGAVQKRFQYHERIAVQKKLSPQNIIFEPSKCIKCGICVRISQQNQEALGFSFIGRGFDVRVGVPFNESVEKGLKKTAALVAEKCPTGALAKTDTEEQI